ncbi:MAG: BamA/TamA family outer membrane protein, partial [Gemmatimonadetes bacterium]|nr:BamA/TamA family outer membrane protein [Gemmatimonadota bacterium]
SFPVYRSVLRGAAFVDFGQVWANAGDSRFREIEVAPGFGLRYFTPIGPIRVDVAYRSANPSSLPVVTTKLIPLGPCPATVPGGTVATPDGTCWTRSNELAPLELLKLWHESRSFFDRLQLHFAIGQAF